MINSPKINMLQYKINEVINMRLKYDFNDHYELFVCCENIFG